MRSFVSFVHMGGMFGNKLLGSFLEVLVWASALGCAFSISDLLITRYNDLRITICFLYFMPPKKKNAERYAYVSEYHPKPRICFIHISYPILISMGIIIVELKWPVGVQLLS